MSHWGGERAGAPATAERFLAGDSLRALAALSVLVFHVANGFAGGADQTRDFTAAYGDLPGRLLQSGRLGVSIFFVLSGYLLSRPFLRAFALGLRRPSLLDYLRNRAVRIVPAFWVVCALTLLWFGADGAPARAVVAIFGFAQTYEPSAATTPLAHAWTLDVEVAFYLALPLGAAALAAAMGRRGDVGRRLRAVAALLVVVAAASLWAHSLVGWSSRWYLTLGPQLFNFIPGIALAALEVALRGRVAPMLSRAAPGALLAGVALLLIWGARTGVSPLDQGLAQAAGAGLIVGGALLVQWSRGGAWRLLGTAPLSVLGRWSYGIYLVHLPLITALLPSVGRGRSAAIRLVLGLPIAVVATLAAASLLHYVVERPAMRLRAQGRDLPATGHAPALASG